MGSTPNSTCALGHLVNQGVAICESDLGPQDGRYVHTDFRITDQLVAYINQEVLKRIDDGKKAPRVLRVIKVSDNQLFLVHDLRANRNQEAQEEAWHTFLSSLRFNLSILELEDSDQLYLLKHGTEMRPRPPAEPTAPKPSDAAMAVYANAHFQGSNLDT